MLYFAYTNGTLVAVNVATFATEPPTGFPTKAPSQQPVQGTEPASASNKPTASPSLRGSNNSTSSGGSGGGGNEAENESAQSSALPIPLPVILGAAAGALLLLIAVVVLVMCCRRRNRGNKADNDRTAKDLEAVRKWNGDKEAYDKACKQQEQETLKEISSGSQVIVGPTPLPTPAPTEGEKKRSNSASRSIPVSPALDSITEDADFDDGSEAGIEVSIADMSVDQMAMSDDESLKKVVLGKQMGSTRLLEPSDPTLVSDFDDATKPAVEVDEDMTPIVRNLSNSFSEVASATSPPKSEKCAEILTVASKPDPEETGGLITEGSSNTAHLELLQAVRESRKEKKADASVLSGTTGDVDSEPVIYRPEDDIVLSSTKQNDSIEFRGRPTSPDFSDIWSVDGSLYLDEESKATRERSVAPSILSQPDDEPGQISKGYRAKSPEPQLRSFATQAATPTKAAPRPESSKPPLASAVSVSRTPATGIVLAESVVAPVIPSTTALPKPVSRRSSATKSANAEPKVESNQPIPTRPVPPPRVSPQVRGGSARPRAGLFTRRENPLVSSNGNSSDSGSEVAPTGYMPEREARASYTPIETKNDVPIPASAVRSISPRSASSSKATERVSNQATSATRKVEPSQLPQRQSSLGDSSRSSPSRNTKKPDSESRLKETTSKSRSSQNQKPSRPQSKSGAFVAWDSFLTELAKVEDTFFNPKLGSTQAAGGRERKRSGRPPARRSRSADAYYDSDSDSESTFSAGLNPVV
jgi:hypothetical protein